MAAKQEPSSRPRLSTGFGLGITVLQGGEDVKALVLLMAGCSTTPSPTPPAVSASPAASGEVLPSLPDGRRYIVDPAASHLRIILGAEGPLAALGHPHVIGGPVIGGTVVIADRWQDSAFRLSELTATGALRTRFSELGLAPYSALGGGLRVADELRIRFQVKAFTDESP